MHQESSVLPATVLSSFRGDRELCRMATALVAYDQSPSFDVKGSTLSFVMNPASLTADL